MSLEGQLLDQKSLRIITGKTADWDELAKDCVAFANATGGHFLLGIDSSSSRRLPKRSRRDRSYSKPFILLIAARVSLVATLRALGCKNFVGHHAMRQIIKPQLALVS